MRRNEYQRYSYQSLHGEIRLFPNENGLHMFRRTGRKYNSRNSSYYEVEIAIPLTNLLARFFVAADTPDEVFFSALGVFFSNEFNETFKDRIHFICPSQEELQLLSRSREVLRQEKEEKIEAERIASEQLSVASEYRQTEQPSGYTYNPSGLKIHDIAIGAFDAGGPYEKKMLFKNPNWNSSDLTTYTGYMRVVCSLIGDEPVEYLDTQKNQIDFMYKLNRQKNTRGDIMATKTIKNLLGALSFCYEYATTTEYPLYNPVPKLRTLVVDVKSEIREALPHDILYSMFTNDTDWNGYRAYAASLFSLLTGMRAGEVLALQPTDISLKERQVVITKSWDRIKQCVKETKTKTCRTSPLTDLACAIVKPLMDVTAPNGFIFAIPGRLPAYPNIVQNGFLPVLRKYTTDKSHVFHSLRHTWFTHLEEQNISDNIRSLIGGHDSNTITLSRMNMNYTTATVNMYDKVREALEKMFSNEEQDAFLRTAERIRKADRQGLRKYNN